MAALAYTKPERVSLKAHPEYSEKWVEDKISEDTSILGLGDLVLRDRQRPQPGAGRLDLLLQDLDSKRRYEVELQLGATDEAHIIRTIEYWDIERKRYPQYEHCAVLIAENITSRFLNVVSLFNGAMPLIAIQMQAYQVGTHLTLIFTKVMDELKRGFVDDDEIAAAAPTTRADWEKRGSKATVALADDLLGMAKELDPTFELKYNKFYIGLARDGKPFNFVTFTPRKTSIVFEPRIEKSDELDNTINDSGLDSLSYDKQWGRYRMRLTKSDIQKHESFLKTIMKSAFDAGTGTAA
ncbi:MAG TPA: hypothetical protein VMF12_18080 [Xanthobacteraceae bacterium]|nr:hypothetical protein [Xanthobacteraceae bacterium]